MHVCISPVSDLKTFYTDIKTTVCVKKQSVSKKHPRFQG